MAPTPEPKHSASLPVELADAIETFLQDHPGLGYQGLDDFVAHAAHEAMLRVQAQLALKEVAGLERRSPAEGP